LRAALRAWPAVLALVATPLAAQEPRPLRLEASYFAAPEGVELNFAWRFAPGAGAGEARESNAFDDTEWRPVRPALRSQDVPADWRGEGWFRRHLVIDPALEGRPMALRFSAPGVGDVYLDGRLVLQASLPGTTPEIPANHSGAVLFSFEGTSHVLAVHYRHPHPTPSEIDGIGFRLSLADASHPAPLPGRRDWSILLQGAIVALPVFLCLLHLALFAFDRQARENLFYAVEMLGFAAAMLRDHSDLLPTESLRAVAFRLGAGSAIIAIFFGLLTYYAVRLPSFPRRWRAFLVAAAILYLLSHFVPLVAQYGWMPYFGAVIVEVLLVERRTRERGSPAARFFLFSFAFFSVTIFLQILVNLELLPPIAGIREVYVIGLLVLAAGMSLYLARNVGQSRVVAAEHERQTLELARARELQLSMLPVLLPERRGLDLAATTRTAAEVGGDYYDVREAEDGELLLAFGDATGHGLAAGVVVTAAKAMFTSLDATRAPAELLRHCDRTLAAMRLPTLRMALALARVSPHEIRLASAAMPPALVHRRADGTVEEIGAGGLPLGTRLGGEWSELRAPLGEGDTILFASDGFAELLDTNDRELGYVAATQAFRAAAEAPDATQVLDRLLATVDAHRGQRALADDVTFFVARVVSSDDPLPAPASPP
jgi:hypothetical protein